MRLALALVICFGTAASAQDAPIVKLATMEQRMLWLAGEETRADLNYGGVALPTHQLWVEGYLSGEHLAADGRTTIPAKSDTVAAAKAWLADHRRDYPETK